MNHFKKQQDKIAKERNEIAKSSKGKTFMGRPVHELDKEQGIKRKSPISKVLKKETGEKEKLSKKRFANGKHWTTDDIPR